MAVSTMKKLTAVTMKGSRKSLIKRLMWLSCVEIDTVDADDDRFDGLLNSMADNGQAEAERSLYKISEAINSLKKYKESKGGLFKARQAVDKSRFENSDSITDAAVIIADNVSDTLTHKASLQQTENKLKSHINSLNPWTAYNVPLSDDHTAYTKTVLGTIPVSLSVEELTARMSETAEDFVIEEISGGSVAKYIAVIYHRAAETEILTSLTRNGFSKIVLNIKDMNHDGTALEIKNHLEAELRELDIQKNQIEETLRELARESDQLEFAYDVINTQITELENERRLLNTESTALLSGWVPVKAVSAVEAELAKRDDCWYEFSDPEPSDNVPVLLQNNKVSSPFETVINLYSLPAYQTFDPTFIMSIFYFIIFGIMLGDVVYGLLLTVGGFLACRFLDLGAGTKKMISMFAICGISCMISGILFGGYLGDFPVVFMSSMFGKDIGEIALWFDMVKEPMNLLMVSMAVGVLHLFAGMGIKFYILCREGKVLDAFFDIGSWYAVFIGIGLYFISPTAGMIVALTGVAALVLTQGRESKNPVMKLLKGIMSLYDIVNYVSDLLSYSRIMALGLASAVVGSVVNTLATMMGPSVAGFIFMPIIMIVGHVINIAINLLGTFVHTSRLQYIEFFGKFYIDGGRPFKPITPQMKYLKLSENK